MAQSARKGPSVGYILVAGLMALSMFFSAAMKLTQNPGAVHVIHDVVGVPLNLFPALAACEIAGGVGLLVGILRPRIGVAAAAGLFVYFVGAIIGHVAARDWAGLKSPIVPFLFATASLILGMKRVSSR